MKVNHYTTYPARGGAGIAAHRLVTGLRNGGVDASLFGLHTGEDIPGVKSLELKRSLFANLHRRYRSWQIRSLPPGYLGQSKSGPAFFTDRSALGCAMADTFTGADILHLHWVCQMMDYNDTLGRIPDGIPVVWTLHDMMPFTGGCIHSLECDNYVYNCVNCPQKIEHHCKEEVVGSFERKLRSVKRLLDRLVIVTPSHWMASRAKRSKIFQGADIRTIPNGLTLEIFNPAYRKAARKELMISDEEFVVLFVAASVNDPIKGISTLVKSKDEIASLGKHIKVCYIGSNVSGEMPEEWTWLGMFTDEHSLAKIYSAADALIVPSKAENYPNVIEEALACGVPVIASNVGGIPELVIEGVTGHLFEYGDSVALVQNLKKLLKNFPQERMLWSENCRKFAKKNFELSKITNDYLTLYKDI